MESVAVHLYEPTNSALGFFVLGAMAAIFGVLCFLAISAAAQAALPTGAVNKCGPTAPAVLSTDNNVCAVSVGCADNGLAVPDACQTCIVGVRVLEDYLCDPASVDFLVGTLLVPAWFVTLFL